MTRVHIGPNANMRPLLSVYMRRKIGVPGRFAIIRSLDTVMWRFAPDGAETQLEGEWPINPALSDLDALAERIRQSVVE